MAKTKEEVSRPGRKCFGDEKMGTGTFRRSQKQADKLCVLGGSEWLRAQIDAAPWPRRVTKHTIR